MAHDMVWDGIQKLKFLSTGTLTPTYGVGGWDPCEVCQHNYFAWFVSYTGNGHLWTGDPTHCLNFQF